MAKFTRREFLRSSSVAAGVLGVRSAVDLWAAADSVAGVTLYVATNGNDAWSGQVAEPNARATDGPFATFERARDAVRELKGKNAPKQPITVMVRGGKYYLKRTLVFGPEDSGSQECPISYKAYTGETVVLSGGRLIAGFKPYKGKILQTAIAGSKGGEWKFRQLFLNAELQIRSRYPKLDPKDPMYGGWLFAERPVDKDSTDAFIYKQGAFPRRWAKPLNGEVVMFPGTGWVDAILPIQSIDESTRKITGLYGFRNPDIAPWYAASAIQAGDRFRVENLLEELTEPGEWYLDAEEGVLYFWPPDGSLKPATDSRAGVEHLGGSQWRLLVSDFGHNVHRNSWRR